MFFHLPKIHVFPGIRVLQAKQEVKEYWLMLPACIFNVCTVKPSENGKELACSKAFTEALNLSKSFLYELNL